MLQNGILALRFFLTLTLLTGVVYPLAVTGVAQTLFAWHAGGSLVRVDGRVAGSDLLGQKFSAARYFWPRPSSVDYATIPSGASNLGWTSAQLKKAVAERRAGLEAAGGSQTIPAELLFASASGLDPHISPEAALYQLDRVATARGFDADRRQKLLALIGQKTEAPSWGFLGEPRINVLQLNLALDSLQ